MYYGGVRETILRSKEKEDVRCFENVTGGSVTHMLAQGKRKKDGTSGVVRSNDYGER